MRRISLQKMTEIPESVRGVLRCDDCNDLLSCGPVLLIHETSAVICGRCSPVHQQQEEERASCSLRSSRILQYEALAGLHSFPCAFANNGCKVIMEFSPEEPNIHEHDCPFRTLICPIVESEWCDWIGSRQKLQEHVATLHADHLFNNPCSLPRPDITKSHFNNFLLSAFNFLFLIHLKVCLISGKIYFSVRMLGDTNFLDKFTFNLEITGNGSKFIKKGSVLRAGVLALQEQTALCTNINSLLNILSGNYDQGKFQLTINTSLKFNCLNCLKDITPELKICDECQGNLVKCKFSANGCLFMDINEHKCRKHESMFCKYQTKCIICNMDFAGGSFIEHLISTTCRILITGNLNSVIRATQTNLNPNYIIFSSNNCDPFIFIYELNNSYFEFNSRFSVVFYELKKLKCSVEITDPRTKHTETITPRFIENDWGDWDIKKDLSNFPSWNTLGIDIKVNVY